MSAEFNFIASLSLIQKCLYKYGGPILMIFGTISCILSLIVFTKKNLRQSPCSIYFIAFNVSNILLLYTSLLLTILASGYDINPSLYSLIYCRFRIYTGLLFDVLSPSYLILASIDRILLTSSNARTRQRSTSYFAFACISGVTLFWMICHSHASVLVNIIEPTPNLTVCYFQTGPYLLVMGYYSVLVKGIIVPLFMIILGLWTLKNIRKTSRTNPVLFITYTNRKIIRGLRCTRSKDHYFIQILLIDIIIYIIFSLMISIVLMYQQLTQYQSQTLVKAKIQVLLVAVGIFSSYVPFCVGFYINLLVSKKFRYKVKNIIMCK